MKNFYIVSAILNESLNPNQTKLSADREKASREKKFLIKLAVLGTAVGIATSSWQLLREPQLRQKVIDAAKQKNLKVIWNVFGVPIVVGAAVDIAAEPATGWVAQRWQDIEDRKKEKRIRKQKQNRIQ